MKTYRVEYIQKPHVEHALRVVFVEANDPDHASELAKDHVERITALSRSEYSFLQPVEYHRPVGGQIVGLQ